MAVSRRKEHMRTVLKWGRDFLGQLHEEQKEEVEAEAKRSQGTPPC